MTIEIKVPVLPESVADALMLDWKKQAGDSVVRDEILVEVETDKVVLEVPAPADGILVKIVAQSGETVLGEQLLALLEPGASSKPVLQTSGQAEAQTNPSGAQQSAKAEQPGTLAEAAVSSDDARTSPAVRRLAEETGLDLATVRGSGRDGRITKADVLDHIFDSAAPPENAGNLQQEAESVPRAKSQSASQKLIPAAGDSIMPEGVPEGSRPETREPMSRLRQTIASRLVQSQQSAALLTTFNEVNMQPVVALREKYKEAFEKKHGARLGFMSFFVKASVVALQRFPLVNACIDGTDIVRHHYHDIGIAVSSPRGLVVPILRNCAGMSCADIELQIQSYSGRAREGRLSVDELSGGTFTITNGGVFGSLLSTPIVNPPQSAILGMHAIQQRPVAEKGEVVIRPMMYLALSYDHRIIDGKEAVQFLITVKDMLEDPARLLLDI